MLVNLLLVKFYLKMKQIILLWKVICFGLNNATKTEPNIILIDNTNINADETAKKIHEIICVNKGH